MYILQNIEKRIKYIVSAIQHNLIKVSIFDIMKHTINGIKSTDHIIIDNKLIMGINYQYVYYTKYTLWKCS